MQNFTLNSRKGPITFESPMTHQEAFDALLELTGFVPVNAKHLQREDSNAPLARNSFACDLALKGWRYKPSPAQWGWIHKIVLDARAPKPEPKAALDLSGLRGMIQKAGETLQFPKINLETAGGQRVRLSRAGAQSKNPGRIHVTDGAPYGESIYFGYIDLDGKFFESGKRHEGVFELLSKMEADPTAIASAYGHRHGSCCFCNRKLTKGESVAVGYGPICADKFGLPWGEESVPSKITVTK